MNRIIKFRAWNKKTKKWLFKYKTLWEFSLTGQIMICEKLFDIPSEYLKNIEFMQYTGLKDKNGNEIYEGDIIEVDWNDARYPKHIIETPVSWNDENACFDLGEGGSPKFDAKNHYEVIGNIWEHKYLL